MVSFKDKQMDIVRNLGDVLNFSFDLQKINHFAKRKPAVLVKSAEDLYEGQLGAICERFLKKKAKIMFVAGPSSAGKTTSSLKIKAELKRQGVVAHVISMDDFFLDKANTPLLPDGSYDFENVTAVDLIYFKKFIRQILNGQVADLPFYDFTVGKRTSMRPLKVGTNERLIIEGLHALNPIFVEGLAGSDYYKVFVAVSSNFTIGDDVIVTAKQLRFMRRLLRDYYKRATTVSETITQWRKVVQGESKYIVPYKASADFILNTTHMYEPLLYDKYLRPVLKSSSHQEIKEVLEIFTHTGSLEEKFVPKTSLIREFLK